MTQVVNRLYDINKPNRQFSTHFNAPQKLKIQKFFFFFAENCISIQVFDLISSEFGLI